MDAFPDGGPHLAALDAVVGNRPVFLESTDGHSAWANTRALELAGITRATPDPPRGRIERDAAGEPTGALHEAAMGLVGELAPEPDQAEWEAAIERGQAHLHRLGITAWQDASVSPAMLAAYRGGRRAGPAHRPGGGRAPVGRRGRRRPGPGHPGRGLAGPRRPLPGPGLITRTMAGSSTTTRSGARSATVPSQTTPARSTSS
ncbi:MAG TPA: amidohydrolase family protein [Actinomycetes bacterium]|jgi:hypothetical protein|nr:amidohydrolase family protein [Actinomycetes bacterium]